MHVVIVGAGPAGLLCAINLLRRNQPDSPPVYTVELVESGEDYGLLDTDGLSKKRSWMIGLAWPGLRAIRRVPGLYEDYVSKAGVEIDKVALYLGRKKIAVDPGVRTADNENYVIDRNHVTAALARYLHDNFKDSAHLKRRFGTRLNFVDAEQRRIHVRAADGSETYLSYDLLVGADGVRSGVRAALVAHHRDFECSVEDIFERFKSIHIDTPEGVEPNFMHFFPSCFRNMNGIGLPETGNRINISIGHRCHQPCDEALRSSDASVVAQYLKDNFKAFPLPYEEFAEAWVKMEWQSTTMTRCNYYHSEKHQIVIMGDAAHATSPSIGMGMNHALGDAAALDELLDSHKNDLSSVLPMYSSLRVKEGHALTDMAALIQSYDTTQSLQMTVRQAARTIGNKIMPSLVAPDPYAAIGNGMKLSEAYAELHRMGRISSVRQKNAAIKQRHFEVASGLIQPPGRRTGISRALGCWL